MHTGIGQKSISPSIQFYMMMNWMRRSRLFDLCTRREQNALIIQDMGLLELDLPPLPLFASTQTHNYSLDKIRFLEKVGFQRIILARELSLKQLREIRSSTKIELSFLFTARCVSVSAGNAISVKQHRGEVQIRRMCSTVPFAVYTDR